MFINRKIKGIKGGGEKKYRFKKLIRVQLSFFFFVFYFTGNEYVVPFPIRVGKINQHRAVNNRGKRKSIKFSKFFPNNKTNEIHR